MIESTFSFIILILSVVIHEVAHGLAALHYGDTTARDTGRLTLNPIRHIDIMGSIVLPAVLIITNAPFMIGWAKPVPYNENNLSDRKWGTIAVASAGIITNFIVAIIFGIFIRIGMHYGLMTVSLDDPLFFVTRTIVLINIVLGLFNLVPIPPLDGSKILFAFLPAKHSHIQEFFEKYSFVFFIVFVFFLWSFLTPAIGFLFTLMTGVS